MLFNSIHYVFYFPIVVALYFSLPPRFRNGMLLIASYYFYMSWIPQYAVLIFISTVSTYAVARLISASASQRQRKAALAVNIAVNLLILGFFKYSAFVVGLTNELIALSGFGAAFSPPTVLLPVGISFYTFQSLGYSIDVYRKSIPCEKNFVIYALFVSFFPQLVAGPIERAGHLLPQFKERMRFDYDQAVGGMRRILVGMFKKVVVADFVAEFVNGAYAHTGEVSGATLLFATFLFAVQIYCDFSGYSDIAVGSAAVLGFRLTRNFKMPYFSSSLGEFWTRWHVSLSTWFRDYVYIPLGGNRTTSARRCLNIFATFALSGLWHGAGLNFIMWGAIHGFYRVVEIICARGAARRPIDKRHVVLRFVGTLWIFLLVLLAWVFFRASGIDAAFDVLGSIFTDFSPSNFDEDCDIVLAKFRSAGGDSIYLFAYIGCIVLPAFLFLVEYLCFRSGCDDVAQFLGTFRKPFRWIVYFIAVLVIIFIFVFENGVSGQTGQFIYFQF